MATLATTHPTLLDVTKRLDPEGRIDAIAEILEQTNEIIDDAVWIESNLPTGHRTSIRTGLPTPTWRKLYGGVQPTKSTTAQITDNCGMLHAYAEVDKELADLNGNQAAFRLSEDMAHLEGMNQEFAQTLFYGNEGSEPEAFTGLSPRYNTKVGAANGDNIIHGGGSGADNASIWLIVWGANSVHAIYPKGTPAGLMSDDKGQITIEDVDGQGGRMEAYRTHYRWGCGLTVRDWRYAVRIANIDKSDLSILWNAGQFGSGADLSALMFQASRLVPSLRMGRPAFYMSRDIATTLFQQVAAKGSSSFLTSQNVGGQLLDAFQGIPIRRCDALAADEALVPVS